MQVNIVYVTSRCYCIKKKSTVLYKMVAMLSFYSLVKCISLKVLLENAVTIFLLIVKH